MAIACLKISSKVMVAPPPLSRVCHGRAKSVKVGSLEKEHREYTRNMEEWQEKLHCSAGTVAWGRSGSRRKRFSTRKGIAGYEGCLWWGAGCVPHITREGPQRRPE